MTFYSDYGEECHIMNVSAVTVAFLLLLNKIYLPCLGCFGRAKQN